MTHEKQKQRRQVVARDVVEGLVDAFLASPKGRDHGYCTSFRPTDMKLALANLPDFAPGLVDYNSASEVLNVFECHKMTGRCNSWTPWMRNRLREAKRPLPDAPQSVVAVEVEVSGRDKTP